MSNNLIVHRHLAIDDAEWYCQMLNSIDIIVEVDTVLHPASLANVQKSLADGSMNSTNNLSFVFETDGILVGVGLIRNIQWNRGSCDLHIIAPECSNDTKWKTEVIALALCSICFDSLSLHRVSMYSLESSQRDVFSIFLGIGAVHEATLRQQVYRVGRYWDKYMFSILATEWLSIMGNHRATLANIVCAARAPRN